MRALHILVGGDREGVRHGLWASPETLADSEVFGEPATAPEGGQRAMAS